MKIRLFFFLSLLILSINVYCSCEDIAENIEACKAYTCSRYIGGENYIKHKILGLDSKNLCIYIEKHNNDEMICHHSEQGRIAEKKYFENIVNQETDNFTDIVRVRSQECFFVNSNNLNYMDQEDVIREATDNDLETLSQYNGIRSIFFDDNQVNKIVDTMEKFTPRSIATTKEQIVNNFNCRTVILDSIVFLSHDIWKIWVNGKLFMNARDLRVQSVNEDHVTFVWHVDQKLLKKQINNSQNVSIAKDSVVFTLYPKQKFDLDSLSIR